MNQNLTFAWVITLTILAACSSDKDAATTFQTLNITAAEIKPMDEIIEAIEFIPFIIPDENPLKLSYNQAFILEDEHLYFSTGDYQDASIHVFDKSGKYLKTFKKQGNGPEEYPFLNGLDWYDGKIAIWDQRGSAKLYDKETFEFMGTKTMEGLEIPFIPDFKKIDQDRWLIVSDLGYENDANNQYHPFYLFNEATKEKTALYPKAWEVTSNLVEGQIGALSDNSFALNFGASDTLYHFQDSIRPLVALNLADNNLPVSMRSDADEFFETVITNQKFSFNVGALTTAGDMIRILIFGIKKNEAIDEDDLSSFPIYNLYIHYPSMKYHLASAFGSSINGKGYSKDGYYYEVLYPEAVEAAVKSKIFGKYNDKLEAAIEQLNDEEDPILLKYKIKP
jgi:hypothetical protein